MQRSRNRLIEQLAWVSVCLLVAAWGPRLDAGWKELCGILAISGLAAAAGLGMIARLRASRERTRQQRLAAARYDGTMADVLRRQKAIAEVEQAVREMIQSQAYQRAEGNQDLAPPPSATGRPGSAPGNGSRIPCSIPVDILVERAPGDLVPWTEGDACQAYLRDLSPNGFGLVHTQPLDTRRIILSADLEDGRKIALVASILWSKREGDGWFSSGGKLVEVAIGDDGGFAAPVPTHRRDGATERSRQWKEAAQGMEKKTPASYRTEALSE